jgi:hypothetical protein
MPIKRLWIVAGGLAAGLLAIMIAPGFARQAQPDDPLLAEVRALRLAIERLAIGGARAQVLLGRVQLQEARIAEIARRLQAVRDRLPADERVAEEASARLKELERINLQNLGADEREIYNRQLTFHQTEANRTARQLQQRRVEEAELVALLSTEQNRWSDFNQRLEELERLLTR